MLGVPLGSDEFVANYVKDGLLPATEKVTTKLSQFEDSQSAMYLLRLSYGIIRANHFMRTTPLAQWSKHAVEFDGLVRSTTESILKRPLSDYAYDQAAVSTRFGGLGIRRAMDHAPVAFNASWCSSKFISKESWTPMEGVPSFAPNQRSASEDVDRSILKRLAETGNDRDRQRLSRLDREHANSWITAQPSSMDGKDTVLPPRIFNAAVARLLGLPVYPKPFPCPLCKQTMDIYGDHALCCKKTGDMIMRHNMVRNWVFKLADVGMLNPAMEKLGLLGDADKSSRRPGDVSIPIWSYGRGLAIDVAVICPFTVAHMKEENPCDEYAIKKKHARYDPGFKGSRYHFAAMVFETSGAVCTEGMKTMRQLIRFASNRQNVGNSVFAGRAWARLGCVIQFGVAQSVLMRDVLPEAES